MDNTSPSPAEIYHQVMVPAIFAAWCTELMEFASLKRGAKILDLACGTGVVSREAAKIVGINGRVVGLDLNAEMLKVAQANPADSGCIVEWQEGDASALPFPEGEFDIVLCQQGFQFFPDRVTAAAEMRRVLIAGGQIVLAVWCSIEHCPGYVALADGIASHIGPDAAALMNRVFSLGDPDEIRAILAEASFNNIVIERKTRVVRFPSSDSFARDVVAGSIVGRSGIEVAKEAMEALVRDVSESLRNYTDAQGLSFPMAAHFVVGTK